MLSQLLARWVQMERARERQMRLPMMLSANIRIATTLGRSFCKDELSCSFCFERQLGCVLPVLAGQEVGR